MSGVGRRRWAVSGSIVTGDWCGCCCCCCCCWRRRCWRCWCGWWQRCGGDHVCRRVLSSRRVSVTVVTGRAIDSHRRHRALTHPSNVKMNSINEQYLTCTVYKETFEDTLVLVGLRRIMTVVFFAPCTNILTYLLTWWTQKVAPPLRILLIFQQCLQIFARNFTQLLNNEIYILSLSWGINISENETICSFGAPRLRWREGPLNLWCSFSNLAHFQKIHGKAWSTRFGDLRVIRREWSWQLAPWRVLCRERARGLVTGVSQQLHYVSGTHFQWRFGVTGVLWALFLCTVLCTLSNEPRILGRLLSRKIVKIGSFWALRR